MKEDIIKRLASLGYTFNEDKDYWVIEFLIEKVTNTIKNETNQSEIPEALYQVAIDMVCGEFLKTKKASGELSGFVIDVNALTLKQKSQGDTSVSFAADKTMSAEERLNAAIDHLINYGKPQFLRWRRLVW